MNKILILSNDNDNSTTKVIRWLNYIDNSIDVVRLHTSDLANAHIYQGNISYPIQIGNLRRAGFAIPHYVIIRICNPEDIQY